MIKRVILSIVALSVLLIAGLAVWQPDALKEKALRALLNKVGEQTSSQITLRAVQGNFFRDLSVQDVEIVTQGQPVFQAKSIALNLNYRALLHKKISLDYIQFEQPVVRVVRLKDKTILLPKKKAPPVKNEPSSWAALVEGIRVNDGRVDYLDLSKSKMQKTLLGKISLEAKLEPQAFLIDKLDGKLEGGRVHLEGRYPLDPEASSRFILKTTAFPFHTLFARINAQALPVIVRHDGVLRIEGGKKGWTVESRGLLDGSPLNFSAALKQKPARLNGRIALKDLVVTDFWKGLNVPSSEKANLNVVFSGTRVQDLNANGKLSWTGQDPEHPGQSIEKGFATVKLEESRGPVVVQVAIPEFSLNSQGNLDLGNKTVGAEYSVLISSLSRLTRWFPKAGPMGGALEAHGSVSGPFADPSFEARISGKDLQWKAQALKDLDLQLQKKTGGQTLVASLKGKDFKIQSDRDNPWDLTTFSLDLTGKKPQWRSTAYLQFANDSVVTYAGWVRQKPQGWLANWDGLAINLPNQQQWTSRKNGEIELQKNQRVRIQDFVLANGPEVLKIDGAASVRGAENLQINLQNTRIKPWVDLLQPKQKFDGILNANVVVQGPWKSPVGDVKVDIRQGWLGIWPYDRLIVSARMERPWLYIQKMDVAKGATQRIQVSGKIPFAEGESKLPLSLQADATALDPIFLNAVVPSIEVSQGGRTDLHLKASGVWPDLNLNGAWTANIPGIKVAEAGLNFTDFVMDIRGQDRDVVVQNFSAKSKDGFFKLSGKSELPDLNYAFHAQNLALKSKDQWKTVLNADLKLAGSLSAPEVEGQVELADGFYSPLKGKAKKEQDEKKKKEEEKLAQAGPQKESEVWNQTQLSVHLIWPRGVWYRDDLSGIETKADIHVEKAPGQKEIVMEGAIETIRGTYVYYGRDFKIQTGEITFTGPPKDPLLNIEALYNAHPTEVTLRIMGSAQNPVLTLSSNPPLPDRDIVSVLAFGRPLNELQSKDQNGNSKQDMTQVAGEVLGSYLSNQLSMKGLRKLDLDVFRIQPSEEGSTRVTVGRYIGPNLFVSFGQSVGQSGGRQVSAEYYISKEWTLQAELGSTESSHLDFTFRYPLNKQEY